MKPELQRIAIARRCGTIQTLGQALAGGWDGEDTTPNYLNDLNAMHEAEKAIPCEKAGIYFNHLREICWRVATRDKDLWYQGQMLFATASQRAEAFLKTFNLWIE